MAVAKFHSLRGKKSALLMVKTNALMFSSSPVYAPRDAVAELMGVDTPEDCVKGTAFKIEDGFTLVDIVDIETGEIRTTESGVPLKQLHY
tara:strand:- start:650 stop:919 length:270 start_codon:yes stop_codon:yes gene_type:complete